MSCPPLHALDVVAPDGAAIGIIGEDGAGKSCQPAWCPRRGSVAVGARRRLLIVRGRRCCYIIELQHFRWSVSCGYNRFHQVLFNSVSLRIPFGKTGVRGAQYRFPTQLESGKLAMERAHAAQGGYKNGHNADSND